MPDGTVAEIAPPHRYEAVAAFVAGLVESGALRPGMRAPSLRQMAAQRKVSLSTAMQAYRLLEDRGVLEARPKSGFYVAGAASISLGTPGLSAPPARPTRVEVPSGVVTLLEHASDPSIAPLGCAVPSAELLAAGRLDRFIARAARVKGAAYNVYQEARGDADLRGEISRRALRWGQAIAPSDIAVTCGCTEALFLALKALTRPGDTVAVESPVYFGLLRVMEAHGLKALELPTDAQAGLDPEALDRALGARRVAACLLSSSFNNPLGCALDEPRKRRILDVLARHGTPLIEDDIYGDIYFTKARPTPFSAIDTSADVIYCSSFSKTVAPGYRVGWLATAAPGRLERVLETKAATTLCGPALPQAAMAEFLSSGGYDNHLRRIRRAFADNIDHMTRAVDRHFPKETRVTRPVGGFVLWLELPEGFDSRALFEAALARKIAFAPGDAFSASGRYRNCLRLSCGHPWDAGLEQSVATLGAMAGEMLAAAR